jgi:hypothetical protein
MWVQTYSNQSQHPISKIYKFSVRPCCHDFIIYANSHGSLTKIRYSYAVSWHKKCIKKKICEISHKS